MLVGTDSGSFEKTPAARMPPLNVCCAAVAQLVKQMVQQDHQQQQLYNTIRSVKVMLTKTVCQYITKAGP